jgi:hypothetical protein
MSGALIHYDAMCQAISAAHAVDEVKDIRDKALAIQIYARQARNVDAEGKACEIRLRAERRVGQLLKETQKAKGASESGTNRGTTRSQTATASKKLDDIGISKDQSSRWQKLAAIPDDDFERTFAKPGQKPSTAGIIAANTPPPEKKLSPIDPRAVWLWGRLLDFERQNVLSADPAELFGTMIDHMKVTTRELAPLVAAWLERLPK